jgi:hypothetical protein
MRCGHGGGLFRDGDGPGAPVPGPAEAQVVTSRQMNRACRRPGQHPVAGQQQRGPPVGDHGCPALGQRLEQLPGQPAHAGVPGGAHQQLKRQRVGHPGPRPPGSAAGAPAACRPTATSAGAGVPAGLVGAWMRRWPRATAAAWPASAASQATVGRSPGCSAATTNSGRRSRTWPVGPSNSSRPWSIATSQSPVCSTSPRRDTFGADAAEAGRVRRALRGREVDARSCDSGCRAHRPRVCHVSGRA